MPKNEELFSAKNRDHGGGLDAAIKRYGGTRGGWIDLSTGINPHPYALPALPADAWSALPDTKAQVDLIDAARAFWQIPDEAAVLAGPGASAIIAQIPTLAASGGVHIPGPTYNEHAAAFSAQGWWETDGQPATARVVVHPNNPTGRLWTVDNLPIPDANLTVIDESFCDVAPAQSMIAEAANPGNLVLKSFGKFWGLAGLRLGFAAGDPALVENLALRLGPWAVSGPALFIGNTALRDQNWAAETRRRLAEDSARLDALMELAGVKPRGGTLLFRLYDVDDASEWQAHLAQHHIWSRVFPYNSRWLRLGLPHSLHWPRLSAALTP